MADSAEVATDAATVKLAAVQMWAIPGEPERNLAVAKSYVADLARLGAKLIVLPEMFISGYCLQPQLAESSDPPQRPYLRQLEAWAAEHDIVIVTAVLSATSGGGLADTAVIVSRDGTLAASDKKHLWGDEVGLFERGSAPAALAQTPIGTVGVAICYEAGFPEVVRDLALRGAEIIAIPAAFGRQRLYAWRLLTRSRALENGCFVVAAGLTAADGEQQFAAHSRIIGPSGEVLAGLGDQPGTVVATVDLQDVIRARSAIPYLADLQAANELTRSEEGRP